MKGVERELSDRTSVSPSAVSSIGKAVVEGLRESQVVACVRWLILPVRQRRNLLFLFFLASAATRFFSLILPVPHWAPYPPLGLLFRVVLLLAAFAGAGWVMSSQTTISGRTPADDS